jgi:hypothetical protein
VGRIRRALGIWLLLFAVYAGTIGIEAFDGHRYGDDEPHYLLTAESIVSDRDVDLTDEYRTRAYADFYDGTLDIHGTATNGRIAEPDGLGFPVLIAPAYALGGPVGVELFLAAIAALGFVLAMPLARRLVPEPWATAAPLAVALSPPALAYSTAIFPEVVAGTILAGACLLALKVRDRPRLRTALVAGGLLAVLPWLSPAYLVPGLVVGFAMTRWLRRRHAGVGGIMALEVVLFSTVLYISINDRLYGGFTPYAALAPGEYRPDADFPGGYLDRAPRLVALWLDSGYGLLRWAPFLALALYAVWVLWRSRREHVARAIAERVDVEVAAGLLLLVAGATLLTAVFLSPRAFGDWFPGRHLIPALPLLGALAALGMRHARRVGTALAALTVGAGAWLYVALRLGHGTWTSPPQEIPLGPLRELLPDWRADEVWPGVLGIAIGVALIVLGILEWRRVRQTSGMARRAFSGERI